MTVSPLQPLDTRSLFRPVSSALVGLLRTLEPDDWQRPTVAGAWTVRDVVTGTRARVECFLHFHPDVRPALAGPGVVLRVGELRVRVVPTGFDRFELHQASDAGHGWYCPRFGHAQPAPLLRGVISHNDGRQHGWRIERIIE